ncbi:hypothetical protein D3C80_1202440 [compost metagenome]
MPLRLRPPFLQGLHPASALRVELHDHADRVGQRQRQQAIGQLFLLDDIAHMRAGFMPAAQAAVKAMSAGKPGRGKGRELQHLFQAEAEAVGHGDAEAGRVVACGVQVHFDEAGEGARVTVGDALPIAVEYRSGPGVVGEGDPGLAVEQGIDVDERGNHIVAFGGAYLG